VFRVEERRITVYQFEKFEGFEKFEKFEGFEGFEGFEEFGGFEEFRVQCFVFRVVDRRIT